MIDKHWIGHELPASVLPIERSRLQFFAKAIGETDPIYTDKLAAQAAGYRAVGLGPRGGELGDDLPGDALRREQRRLARPPGRGPAPGRDFCDAATWGDGQPAGDF